MRLIIVSTMPTLADAFKEDAVKIDDNDLKSKILDLASLPYNEKESSPIQQAKFACKNSDCLKVIKYYISKLLVYCLERNIDLNDEILYYEFDGPGRELIAISIYGKGTLDIIKYLMASGCAITNRRLTTTASLKNKFDILKFLVESGAEVQWGLDEECCNTYNVTRDPQIKAYLKQIGKQYGLTNKDFILFEEV